MSAAAVFSKLMTCSEPVFARLDVRGERGWGSIVMLALLVSLTCGVTRAESETSAESAEASAEAVPPEGNEGEGEGAEEMEEPPGPAIVDLKDGSVVIGEIVSMVDGKLIVNTVFGGEVEIKWGEVKRISSPKKLRLVLENEDALTGPLEPSDDDTVKIRQDGAFDPAQYQLTAVSAINPPPVRPVRYRGNLNLGASAVDGNTERKSLSLNGEFIARSKRQRLTLRGAYNYVEEDGDLTERNGNGRIKYDFFITERVFVYVSSLFENDRFNDLRLRTALSAGLGYQFINEGDFENEFLRRLEVYGEVGFSYFSEDFRDADDDQYGAGRWALSVDWQFIPEKMEFFHRHEGFPSLENGEDIYISTEQGIRFFILANFIATLQANWRWDNTPAPGNERGDTVFLATLGYNFDI